jgi:membrane-associated phospholipid phosphatase
MRILAHLISWVFLPLLMPIYGLLITMFLPSFEQSYFQENTLFWMPDGHKFAVITMFFIFSFLAPAITLVLLLRTKAISSIEVDNQGERTTPIVISAIYCLILGLFLLFKAPDHILPASIYALPWGGFVGISLAGFINKYTKISLHGIGVGMFVGFLIAYFNFQMEFYFEIIIIGVVIAGLVMSARILLGKHTLKQVIYGFFLGFLSVFTCVSLFNMYYL